MKWYVLSGIKVNGLVEPPTLQLIHSTRVMTYDRLIDQTSKAVQFNKANFFFWLLVLVFVVLIIRYLSRQGFAQL